MNKENASKQRKNSGCILITVRKSNLHLSEKLQWRSIYHNLFQETISYSDRHMSPRNLYLIRQPGRSLMVDTSFRFEQD